jgi:colicin import membrane protein
MDAAADRPEFAPPRSQELGRGFVLALVAHALLVAGLASGLKWQREEQSAGVEAELWAAVPQEAAPPPPPPPPPAPPAPTPAPPPVVRAPPPPDPQVQRDAQIAQEREKKRELEKQKLEELEREREERRKLEAKKKREEELAKKKEQAKEQARLVAEAKRKEDEKKRKEQEAKEARETQRMAKLREENMRRMQGMAGTGAPSSSGAAARASGPSAGWAARVNARVRPNIVFTDSVSGNPQAEIEVRLAPDGTIVSRRITKSSGSKAWDEAVLRALDRTETLPRDTDGSMPRDGTLVFRPKG